MSRDVVVTGLGAVTPLGGDVPSSWDAACAGVSGISRITRFDPDAADLRSHVAGEVPIDPTQHVLVDDRRMGRYTQYAVVAVDEALEDAELDPDGEAWSPARVGTSIASGVGGFPEIESAVGERPPTRFTVTFLPNMAAGHVSILFDAGGPNRSSSTACAAGTHGISDAARDIRDGMADVMIAGGTEASLSPLGVRGFDVMRALSTRNDDPEAASRPFDADRDGFVIAEGAGVLILEAREHAEERDASIYAELSGWGLSADAHHETQPPEDARGLTRCLRNALDRAGRDPGEVDHVNTHATSTPRGDAHEATALNEVFPHDLPVTSNKSMIGHTLGASGAIEATYSVKAIDEQTLPPTINYETPDPDCDVTVVTEVQERDVDVVVSNSAGFGGTNGTLVFERPQP